MWAQAAGRLLADFGADPERLKQVFDYFPLGVLMTDLEGRIIYYNPAHAKLDDLEPAEVLGRLEIEVLAPITGPNIMQICQKTARPILGYIYPYRTAKGRVVNAAYWVYPILKGDVTLGAICFTQPLLGELEQGRPYRHQPIQWPGIMPINLPQPVLVGTNKAFKKALTLVKNNAGNPFPMMIAGETGSGKEMLVKLAQRTSPRRGRPYLAVNCSAIPGPLLEGLLFGTTKGSFTGAIDRAGLFEEVNGGTVYLDEIDSMPLELQPKLLRVIQDMKVSRLGSTREIKLDLKIISSIGGPPQSALKSGRLRDDLFYRLAVVVVDVPPLRKRLDDLELLTEHFICKYNNILGKSALKLDQGLLMLMRDYHWPGNVRELEHMLAGALTQVRDEYVIGLKHIPEYYLQAFFKNNPKAQPLRFDSVLVSPPPDRLGPPKTAAATDGDSPPVKHLKREERILREYLLQTRGNVTRAARLMGVSRQLFNYRMLKFGLNYRDFRKA